jgi:hypothetical protein
MDWVAIPVVLQDQNRWLFAAVGIILDKYSRLDAS